MIGEFRHTFRDFMIAPAKADSYGISRARRGLRWLRRGLLLLALALLLTSVGHAEFRPTALELAMAPHRYSILEWELGHLSHKWLHTLGLLLPGQHNLTDAERAEMVTEFFDLGLAQRRMEGQIRRAEMGGRGRAVGGIIDPPLPGVSYLRDAIAGNKERRAELLPHVEHTVEEILSRAAREQGLDHPRLGLFPPVDTSFGSPPAVLVLSPRDRIYRQDAFLLQPGLEDSIKDELEGLALEKEDLSAVVEPTGGLSVYPSVVMDTAGLRFGLEVAAHEWVHHWLFFRPLGRNFNRSPEMLTLNETAATIVGEELGDMAYTALTGEVVARPWVRGNPAEFDFAAEMRETRIRAEELLAQGDIEGAESFMEERRRLFVGRGYNIRKLNQAYFAFHGSYATGAGSVSPIGEQLQELRRRSGSVGEFLRTMSQFGNYGDYLDYWEGLEESSFDQRGTDYPEGHKDSLRNSASSASLRLRESWKCDSMAFTRTRAENWRKSDTIPPLNGKPILTCSPIPAKEARHEFTLSQVSALSTRVFRTRGRERRQRLLRPAPAGGAHRRRGHCRGGQRLPQPHTPGLGGAGPDEQLALPLAGQPPQGPPGRPGNERRGDGGQSGPGRLRYPGHQQRPGPALRRRHVRRRGYYCVSPVPDQPN